MTFSEAEVWLRKKLYTVYDERVMMIVKRFNCVVLLNEMQLFCRLQIGIPKAEEKQILEKLQDMHGVDVKKVS